MEVLILTNRRNSLNRGKGFSTGKRAGRGAGLGGGGGLGRGEGRGRMGGTRPGAGPAGFCVCPSCGHKVSHTVGTPCYSIKCLKCGINMVRQ